MNSHIVKIPDPKSGASANSATLASVVLFGKNGAPGRIRTYDLWIRSPLLYPAELQAQVFYLNNLGRMTRLELATTGATIRSSTKLSYIRHLCTFGTPERIRTSDLLIRSQLLYPAELRARVNQFLSCAALVGVRGFEPPTPCSQSRCASQAAPHPEHNIQYS